MENVARKEVIGSHRSWRQIHVGYKRTVDRNRRRSRTEKCRSSRSLDIKEDNGRLSWRAFLCRGLSTRVMSLSSRDFLPLKAVVLGSRGVVVLLKETFRWPSHQRDFVSKDVDSVVILSLPLCPSILIPRLDLSLWETQSFGYKVPFGNRQVLLKGKLPLQKL